MPDLAPRDQLHELYAELVQERKRVEQLEHDLKWSRYNLERVHTNYLEQIETTHRLRKQASWFTFVPLLLLSVAVVVLVLVIVVTA